jgi:putative ABC transport system permease protein
MRGDVGLVRIVRRQLFADRAAVGIVVLVVVLTGTLFTAWPRVVDGVLGEDLRENIAAQNPRFGDVTGQVSVRFDEPGSGDAGDLAVSEFYREFGTKIGSIASGAPPLVRSVLGDARYQLVTEPMPVAGDPPDGARDATLRLIGDRGIDERIRWSAGRAPEGLERDEDATIVELAMSEATANRLGWQLDEVRPITLPGTGGSVGGRLTGIYAAIDPADRDWTHGSGVLEPAEEVDLSGSVTVHARAFVEPTVLPSLGPLSVRASVWYPIGVSGLDAADGQPLADELRRFTARHHDVSVSGDAAGSVARGLALQSRTMEVIDQALTRQSSASALFALVAVGPFGVALAVLAIAGRLVIGRRERAMALIGARGASTTQLRAVLALEGLLLGLPAAGAAIALATWLVPDSAHTGGAALALAVGVAPAVLLPAAARRPGLRPARADLRDGPRPWRRDAADLAVIWLAAAAVIVLNQRGLAPAEPGVGADPLLVAVPLASQNPPSNLVWKVAFECSVEEKVNVASLLLTVPEGPETMVVSGGVVS